MIFDSAAAATLCEDLSLARAVPPVLREQARHELYFHLRTADELFAGWRHEKMTFVAPAGWRAMNPSVTRLDERLVVAQRCTNYVIDDRGPSAIPGTPPYSRTFLLEVDPESLAVSGPGEITMANMESERKNEAAQGGFEDMRIFQCAGDLHCVFTRCDQNDEGWTEQWAGWLSHDGVICDRRRLRGFDKRRPEKNWIPFATQDGPWFIYTCDPTVVRDGNGMSRTIHMTAIAADHFRGSSQGIEFHGGLLALVHSVTMHKMWPKNMHRFVWFDRELKLRKISDAFLFPKHYPEDTDYLNGYQYGMGLCEHPDESKLVVSYSIGDGQGFLATLGAADVWQKMRDV